MNVMIVDRLIIFARVLFSLFAVSVCLSVFLGIKLKKEKKTIVKGVIVDSNEVVKTSSYLDEREISPAQLFSMNVKLQESEPGVSKLETIPLEKVSKLFLNGRGSWRLTQGNIFTIKYLLDEMRREYSKKL